MNYSTFLSEVDRMSAALDAEALRAFVHELARTFPETERLRLSTTTNQAVCSLLPNERFIPEYLYYAVASKKEWMISQCQGCGQPNISQGIVKSMKLIDAPISEQKQFTAFVSQIDKSKIVVQKALDESRVLYESLMQKYFG